MGIALLHTPTPANPGIQQRQSPRRRVIKNGLIVFQQGHCSMRCRILDLSDTGAMLAPSDILLCPREFVLKPDVGEPRNCEVMWRRADKLGVPFF